MGFKSDEIRWKWSDSTTTTTTTGKPIETKTLERKIGDKIEINSPIDIGVIGEPKGWICPRCGRVNAPWVSQCACNGIIFKKIDPWTETGIPAACRNCSNHPSNGGSGICLCTLGTYTVTC